MGDVTLRRATAADAACISLLGTQVFLDTYAKQGISDTFVREVKSLAGVDVLLQEMAKPAVEFILAERNAHLLGFAQWTAGARHALLPQGAAAQLDRLYVQEASTGRGVGKALLAAAESGAARGGAAVMWLTAWVGNPRALAFYARQGYRDAGSTPYTFEGVSFENRVFTKML